jgi:hypothetical protein
MIGFGVVRVKQIDDQQVCLEADTVILTKQLYSLKSVAW